MNPMKVIQLKQKPSWVFRQQKQGPVNISSPNRAQGCDLVKALYDCNIIKMPQKDD